MACRFKLITDMRLSYCSLHHGAFNDFPCLNFLRLFGCECTSLKLSGLELVRLEMQELFCESTIEVYAPKLKYFFYQSRIVDWNCFPKLDLPVLDRAYIRIQWTDMLLMENGAILRERANCASVSLLCGCIMSNISNSASTTITSQMNRSTIIPLPV